MPVPLEEYPPDGTLGINGTLIVRAVTGVIKREPYWRDKMIKECKPNLWKKLGDDDLPIINALFVWAGVMFFDPLKEMVLQKS